MTADATLCRLCDQPEDAHDGLLKLCLRNPGSYIPAPHRRPPEPKRKAKPRSLRNTSSAGRKYENEVAEMFGIRPLEVVEVVSFYNMLRDRPAGRHQVFVCTSLACSLRGSRGLLRALESHLGVRAGETSADGRITLGHEECLGACAGAPMLRVGAAYHENLDVGRAKALLDGLE